VHDIIEQRFLKIGFFHRLSPSRLGVVRLSGLTWVQPGKAFALTDAGLLPVSLLSSLKG
jgi:hypothetical protein